MLDKLKFLILDERLRTLRFYLAIAIYLAILAIGSIPGARQEIGLLASGIILHSVAYGFLTFLLFTGTNGTSRRRALVGFAIVVAMGALDETIQSALPYRVGSVADLLVDSVASAVTAFVSWACMPLPMQKAAANAS